MNVADAESLLPELDNAGSIFLGRYTPESVGGLRERHQPRAAHVYGYSRMYSGVSLDSFVKYMTVQELTKEGLDALGHPSREWPPFRGARRAQVSRGAAAGGRTRRAVSATRSGHATDFRDVIEPQKCDGGSRDRVIVVVYR